MKALLFLAAVFAVIWLWRNRTLPGSAASPPAAVQVMVCCSHCGVHIPGNEVALGIKGAYCSIDHLHQAES